MKFRVNLILLIAGLSITSLAFGQSKADTSKIRPHSHPPVPAVKEAVKASPVEETEEPTEIRSSPKNKPAARQSPANKTGPAIKVDADTSSQQEPSEIRGSLKNANDPKKKKKPEKSVMKTCPPSQSR